MGAIFFYVFIYFLGYYGSNILNMFTVRPLITNRFTAALIPVFCVAMLHGYMIVTKPPPASQDITVESALFTYVAMPVVIVTLGAFYFMWNARRSEEEEAEDNRSGVASLPKVQKWEPKETKQLLADWEFWEPEETKQLLADWGNSDSLDDEDERQAVIAKLSVKFGRTKKGIISKLSREHVYTPFPYKPKKRKAEMPD